MRFILYSALFVCIIATMAENASASPKDMCIGCRNEVKPEDLSKIEGFVTTTLAARNAKNDNNEEPQRFVRVMRASQQIVNGVKYTVDFETEGETSKKPYICKAEFVVQIWKSKEPQVLDFECSPKPKEST